MSLAALGGQWLMAEAYGSLSVPEAAIWLQLLPIVTYLMAVPVLGEAISGFAMAGGAVHGGGRGLRDDPRAQVIPRRPHSGFLQRNHMPQ